MVQVTPNLHFNGQCKQAIQLYREAFGAQVKTLLCESDADPNDWVATEDTKDLIYHCEVFIGGQRIILSDSADLQAEIRNHTMSLVITFDSSEEVKSAFSRLSDGCTIVHPMQSTTYSSCFVSLIDRFGMRWELMTEQTEQ